MYYVSYITEYPIYEPAEGGYYYTGETVQFCRGFSTWKKANRFFQKIRKEFLEEHEDTPDRINDAVWGGVGKWVNPAVYYHSRYVGEGERVELTRTKPHDIGWQPYC